jgi:hypothetical protein
MSATEVRSADSSTRSASARTCRILAGAGFVAVMALGTGLRLVGLGRSPSPGWDEGAYLMAARLMAAGYEPFRHLYMPQIPLFLRNLSLAFRLFGDSMLVGRLVVVAYSIAGLAAVGYCSRAISNRAGGLAAILFLAVNPGHLAYSRAVFLEVPASSLGMLSMACVLAFWKDRRRSWLVAAGALFGAAILTKPFLLGLGLPLLFYPALLRGRDSSSETRRLRASAIGLDWLAVCCGLAAPLVWFLATTDLAAFREQFLAVNARLIPADAWRILLRRLRFLRRDLGMLYLVPVALWTSLRRSPRPSPVPVALGTLGMVAFILCVPSFYHHGVVLIPPLAALAGAGVGLCLAEVRPVARWEPRSWRAVAAVLWVVGALALGLYVRRLPIVIAFDRELLKPEAFDVCKAAMTRLIRKRSAEGAYVVSDEPMLVYDAGRLVPPRVAIASGGDVGGGGIDAEDLIQAAERYQAPLVVASVTFDRLPEWMDWVRGRYHVVAECTGRKGRTIVLYQRPKPRDP